MAPRVSVQHEDFDLTAEVAALRAGDGGVGAVVAFVGTVRESSDGQGITGMELEHYPGMTESAIEAMIDAALQRFELRAVRVVHRVGALQPADQIVLVAVTSAHRGQAFPGLRVPDGLPEDAGAVLEEGAHGRWRALGRCTQRRRCRVAALGHRLRQCRMSRRRAAPRRLAPSRRAGAEGALGAG